MKLNDLYRNGRKLRYKNRHWKVGEVRKWTNTHTLNFIGSAIFIIAFSVFFCVLFAIIGRYIN